MELHVFQSNKGDCLLLEGSQGGRVLCDGGMRTSMRKYVREALGKLHSNNQRLDAVYVSHIDQDHISGVLQLLEDLLEWRVYEHHQRRGHRRVRRPRIPRPPEIDGLWHNAFRDLITRNRGRIEDLLAASVPLMFGTGVPDAMHYAAEMQNIASSIPEALRVSRLVKPDLLKIPLNRPPGRPDPGQLLLIEDPNDPFKIGSLNFKLIGPSKNDLRKLRKGWDNWLRNRDNRADARAIRDELRRRAEEFASGAREGSPFDLRNWNGIPDFRGVTVPNTASLMFLVEDAGHTLMLTGDSQQDVILDDLKETGELRNGYIHVDILKVPHHASEHNADRNFCRRVSADNYVFCGNGSNGNPEPDVLELFYKSRLGNASELAMAPEARGRKFTFWFSTNSAHQTPGSAARRNFIKTEQKVARLVSRSNGRLEAKFNDDDSLTVRV